MQNETEVSDLLVIERNCVWLGGKHGFSGLKIANVLREVNALNSSRHRPDRECVPEF